MIYIFPCFQVVVNTFKNAQIEWGKTNQCIGNCFHSRPISFAYLFLKLDTSLAI